jgi:flagellar hook-length control protein FliK
MSHDSAVNRVSSSDPAQTRAFRKSKGENYEFDNLSFFDELMSIGVFESQSLNISDLPVSPPLHDLEQSNHEVGADDHDKPEKAEEATISSVDYPELMAMQAVVPVFRDSEGTSEKDAQEITESFPALVETKDRVEVEEDSLPIVARETSATSTTEVESSAHPTQDAAPSKSGNAEGPKDGQVQNIEQHDRTTRHETPHARDTKANSSVGEKKGVDAGHASNPEGQQLPADFEAVEFAESHSKNMNMNVSKEDQQRGDNPVPNAERHDQAVPRNRRSERLTERTDSKKESAEGRHNAESDRAEAIVVDSAPERGTEELTLSSGGTPSLGSNSNELANMPTPIVSSLPSMAATSVAGIAGVGATTVSAATGLTANFSPVNSSQAQMENANPSVTASTSTNSSAGKSEAARGSTGSSITPYQEIKLVQRVLRGLEQLGDGGGQVKLRLHPPELGTLQLTLRMEGGQMFAQMEVENPAARDALLNNLQSLKDRLAGQGMQIETFDVQISSESSSSGANNSNQSQNGGFGADSRWSEANSRFAQMNANRLSSPAEPSDRDPQTRWTRTNGSLDLTV